MTTSLPAGRRPRVAVCTVTHNDAAELPGYLEGLARLAHRPLEAIVVDCASDDGSREIVAEAEIEGVSIRLVQLDENLGFAGGMNRAIAATSAPFILSLNADALPEPDYVERLLEHFMEPTVPRVGAVTGRLRRMGSEDRPVLDAAGMRLAPSWRHLDRGSDEEDQGQYRSAERVFGATGAASLFSRPALEDAAVDGECFLSEFHSFREDAELAFRLRERGWEIIYEPLARAAHRRSNLPRRRRSMPAHVNYHSLKNRFLLRAYHETWASVPVTLLPALWRDLAAVAYVVASERSSLPAFAWLWSQRRHILRRRRRIQGRRIVPRRQIASWFLSSGRAL